MTKRKSEPQQTTEEPENTPAGAARRADGEVGATTAGGTKPRASAKRAKAGEQAAPAAKAPASKPARGRGRGKDQVAEARSTIDDDDGDVDEREDRDDDDHEGEDRGDGDGDVVEVVGEIVDEPEAEGEPEADGGDIDASELPSKITSSSNEAALSRTDPLQAYLREVQRHPLLSPDDEKRLTEHYVKTQDVRTAARLVTSNLRLVVKLAYEYRRAYKNIMDLIQEGNIGLMQAVKRYDPYRGVKLSSYAAWWIRAYILRFILNNSRLVKLGTTQAQRKLFFNLNKEKAKLSAMGIEPTAAEIAKRLDVEEKEVVDMDRRLSSGEASLDAPAGDAEGRAVSRVEMMPSALSGPDVMIEASEMGNLVRERLQRFRETLKGKDVVIFDKRMAAEDPLTLQELGDEFGISRERVRQLEARLTLKLRNYLKEELGDAVGAG
ncbi:RNA polymerase sigma factor RpoH [Minicystis rosea]|nr:RNA polymerase sigma factor RpoH [Minicystis rosea]